MHGLFPGKRNVMFTDLEVFQECMKYSFHSTAAVSSISPQSVFLTRLDKELLSVTGTVSWLGVFYCERTVYRRGVLKML